MIISELIEKLQQIKNDYGEIEVVRRRYSDCDDLDIEDVTVITGIKHTGYIENIAWCGKIDINNMKPENRAKIKKYCYFEGN